MNNSEIAATFETIADLLAIRGDQVHRIMAYRRAAENIRELNRDLKQIHEEGELTKIPGIGATLASKIEEMLTTGHLSFYDHLAEELPPTLVELLRVESLGPKRVKQLYKELGIVTVADLEQATQEGKLRNLPGFGQKSEERIFAGLALLASHGDGRVPLGDAYPVAREILDELLELKGVEKGSIAGSLRRMRETIGDIDILVAADDSQPVMEHFCRMSLVDKILGSGTTKSSVVLLNSFQVDLRVLPANRWGTLLSYFTGSQAHNIHLRELAIKGGYSLNEHAFTSLDGNSEILCANEEEVYNILGMPYIPPVLREDRGEIEAALRFELPELIVDQDIIADLHLHSTWSDGKMSILEMAQAAQRIGLKYIVVTDHSSSLGIANGLSIQRLIEQESEIQMANAEMGSGFRILHGTEMEIRADGSLDYPDDVLAKLDVVIASLHVGLRQPREQIMARLQTAINNPHVDMIAHPTGRLLPDRPAADLDMEELLQAAAKAGTILEINANPQRLDLRDTHVRRANELGVKIAINSDAHHSDHYGFLMYGVATAQRGWTSRDNVVNTWPVDRLLDYLNVKA